MPGYVIDALQKSQHTDPTRPHHSPHQWTPPSYIYKAPQMAQQIEYSPYLTPDNYNTVQQVVGTFLYYSLAVERTIIATPNSIAADQSRSTLVIEKNVLQLLN